MLHLFNDKDLFYNFYIHKPLWVGCFGSMSIITHDYLTFINNKYDISKLLNCVLTRDNRSAFERVIACILQKENKSNKIETLLGNIHKYVRWGITFDEIHKFKDLPLIKIWAGR